MRVVDGPEDIDVYGVSGEFFIPDTQFYVSGALNQVKLAGDKNTGYAVEAGFLPIDGLHLQLAHPKKVLILSLLQIMVLRPH